MTVGTKKHIETMAKVKDLGNYLKNHKWTPEFMRELGTQEMAKKLYDACMVELLNNPDLTKDDAVQLLHTMVEQATENGKFLIDRFEVLFTGTLENMGISTSLKPKEVHMSDKPKLRDRIQGVTLKAVGKRAGALASTVSKPALKLYDGFMEGWTSKERPERS